MKITAKKLGLAAFLVLASSFAVADNTYSLDAFATNHSHQITFDTTFNTGIAGDFTDTLTFTAPGTSPWWNFSALISAPDVSIIEFTDISLLEMTGAVYQQNVFSIAEFDDGTVTNYRSIAPGTYSLMVSGTAFDANAEYDIAAVLSPVPEPSAIALMLGGLGMVGFMAARRRKNA